MVSENGFVPHAPRLDGNDSFSLVVVDCLGLVNLVQHMDLKRFSRGLWQTGPHFWTGKVRPVVGQKQETVGFLVASFQHEKEQCPRHFDMRWQCRSQ